MSENPNRSEFEANQASLKMEIEGRIKSFLGTPFLHVKTKEVGYVDPKLMQGEGETWKDRRDTYDIFFLLLSTKKDIRDTVEKSKAKASILNLAESEQPQLNLTPESVIVLHRQQKFNWEVLEEIPNHVSLTNVLMAADRYFYLAYRGKQEKEAGYSQQDIDDAFCIRNLISAALLTEETFKFKPTSMQDVSRFSSFMQVITNSRIIEQKKRLDQLNG